jgi:hypothetical protein
VKRIAAPLSLTTLGAAAVAIAAVSGAGASLIDVIVVGTALAIGDLFELRPANRAPLPVGFAFAVVLLRAATTTEFVAIAIAAALLGAALRAQPSTRSRAAYAIELITAGLAACVAFRVTTDALPGNSRTSTLVALVAAAVIEIVVADVGTFWRDRQVAPLRERGADAAVVSSGILMAVGYGGLAGTGRLGLWGPALFCVPLLATWYSFELLRRTRATFLQTVQALGVAPELGGMAPPGHVERVANLVVEMGRELGVSQSELRDLDTAAWLHHLGAVCLDEPGPGSALDRSEVAQAGAEMLRATQVLAAAGDIVAAEPASHRPPAGEVLGSAPTLLGQLLKVASVYDELTSGNDREAEFAIETLFSEPAYIFDARALGALEVVIARRRLQDR